MARRQIGTLPPAAMRLAELATQLQQGRNLLAGTTLRYEEVKDTEEVESPSFVVALRGMKVSASELAVEIATTALAICGMSGYRRDSSHTMDRLVRDSLGSLVMVSNDRYLYNNAQTPAGHEADLRPMAGTADHGGAGGPAATAECVVTVGPT